ncbi:DnaB-like helicase N-terminal domain-containing protein, partial [Sphingomonas sp.]|uniref:DnaB-like helicase N-terminal domain-containing protein n=1 Tax=Sphingomonas sp. TaxID=28214 RepID=UPI0035C86408
MATLAFPAPAPAEAVHLPRNVEAEAAMLGAMMIDNRLADDIVDRLEPQHFYEPVHGRIFAAIKTLRGQDMLATPVTLRPMFEADEGMRELGGPAYLASLTGSGAGLIGARQFATQIYDLAMLRALVTVGRTLVDRAMDTSEEVNPRAQIEAAEEELFKVAADGGAENSVKTFAQASTAAVKMAERALNWGGNLSGVTTGLDSVNAKIGGLHHSDLMILAGRPGMGKTSLATNIAYNAARRWMRDMADGIPPAKSVGRSEER